MRTLEQSAIDASILLVLLPGALQAPEDLLQAGFGEAIARRQLRIDLAVLDPALHYIGDAENGSKLTALHQTLLALRQRRPYQALWLGGISIGGFMSLAYAASIATIREPAAPIDGLCLLSPYPGSRMLVAEITAVGGIDGWRATSAVVATPADGERQVWQWLKARRQQPEGLPIHLAYGKQDRFASGQELMAHSLRIGGRGSDGVDALTGGHDWPTWLQLWENFLDRQAAAGRSGFHTDEHKP